MCDRQGSASLLSYVPRSQMDYGTVLCRAANLVGRQVVPCVYHVIPAGEFSSSSSSLSSSSPFTLLITSNASFLASLPPLPASTCDARGSVYSLAFPLPSAACHLPTNITSARSTAAGGKSGGGGGGSERIDSRLLFVHICSG